MEAGIVMTCVGRLRRCGSSLFLVGWKRNVKRETDGAAPTKACASIPPLPPHLPSTTTVAIELSSAPA